MHALFSHAGIGVSMLLFFFVVFVAVAAWAYWPANKTMLESYKDIPLREDPNE